MSRRCFVCWGSRRKTVYNASSNCRDFLLQDWGRIYLLLVYPCKQLISSLSIIRCFCFDKSRLYTLMVILILLAAWLLPCSLFLLLWNLHFKKKKKRIKKKLCAGEMYSRKLCRSYCSYRAVGLDPLACFVGHFFPLESSLQQEHVFSPANKKWMVRPERATSSSTT